MIEAQVIPVIIDGRVAEYLVNPLSEAPALKGADCRRGCEPVLPAAFVSPFHAPEVDRD